MMIFRRILKEWMQKPNQFLHLLLFQMNPKLLTAFESQVYLNWPSPFRDDYLWNG